MIPGCWRNRDRVNSMQSAGIIMPRSKRKNTPTSYRYLSFAAQPERAKVMGARAFRMYFLMLQGKRIQVTPNPKRLRYHLAGQRVYRRHIDQLVYHGVLDETELKGEL